MPAIQSEVEELERQTLELQPELTQGAALAKTVVRLRCVQNALANQIAQVEPESMARRLADIESDLRTMEEELAEGHRAAVPKPPIQDVRWTLPMSAAASRPRRKLSDIERIILHQSATLNDTTPEQLARAHLEQGKPGIACHFLVTRDGSIWYTQPLDVVVRQAVRPEMNRDGIAITLEGKFTGEPPGNTQLAGAAALIAWLLSRFDLGLEAVSGRRDLENDSSPGAQWSTGATYRETLVAMIRARLGAADAGSRLGGSDEAESIGSSAAPAVRDIEVPAVARDLGTCGSIASEATASRIERPEIVDVVDSLPRHPTLPPYPSRTKPVSVIAIHHTDTLKTATVQQIAQYHVYGVRRDARGYLLKAQWPGIGYHFVIGSEGTIYQCQREQTRSYHVGGDPNDYCVGISLIGRFMRLALDGTLQPPADQIPTPAQMRSTAQLAAWLMQELNVPIESVIGHKDVWPRSTACPGENWEAGFKWRDSLREAIRLAQGSQPVQRMEHFMLFWDHGSIWAKEDWQNAQECIAHFRPTTGFLVEDALLARHVTIVGGPDGISPADEARLRSGGVDVHRLNGATEADTKALLDQLVAENTPWPGAPPRQPATLKSLEAGPMPVQEEPLGSGQLVGEDEWTVPEDWEGLIAPPAEPWAVTRFVESVQ